MVGLMGSAPSQCQADLITSHFDRVFVMLDGDDAGRQGSAAIAGALASRMSVVIVALEDGTSPIK